MPRRARTSTGIAFALASVFTVQIGAAAATPVFAQVGPAGTAWLRLCWAAVIFVAIARPRPWAMPRRDLGGAVLLGLASAGLTQFFFAAIARIPLGTAVAIEFLGPLTVAVLRRSGRWGWVWPPLAFAGVLLMTKPWSNPGDWLGIALALAAGVCWGLYILLTQFIGDRFHGVSGLAISIPVAALAALPLGLAQAAGHLTPLVILQGLGIAVLMVIPYALELFALRWLSAGTFGTLMSVEPAAALLVGAVMLHQIPGLLELVGVLCVTVAAVGASSAQRVSGGSLETAQV